MNSTQKNESQASGLNQTKVQRPPLSKIPEQNHLNSQNNFQQIKGILKNKQSQSRPQSAVYKKQNKKTLSNQISMNKHEFTKTMSNFEQKLPKLNPNQMMVPIKRTLSSDQKKRDKVKVLMQMQRSITKDETNQTQLVEQQRSNKNKQEELNACQTVAQQQQAISDNINSNQIVKLNDVVRNKLRRDLNQAINDVKTKKEILQKLKNDLKAIDQQIERETKFDKISRAHDDELIKKLSIYESKKTLFKQSVPQQSSSEQLYIDCQQPKNPSEIHMNPNSIDQLSDDHDEHCMEKGTETESKALHYQRHLRLEQERQAEEQIRKYEAIDIDAGISNQEFQPSKLLEWKRKLIDLMEQSKFNQEKEKLDQQSLKYMLERLEGQQGYEIAMIRELDPYFDFQSKIYPTLQGISQGKESRKKMMDQKVFQMKKQLRDKKSQQTTFLRQRCNELAELEKDNKKMKSKMLGGNASPGPTSTNKDTSSVAGSQATKSKPIDSMSGLELKKRTDDVSHQKQELEPQDIKKEPENIEKDLEIQISNCMDINQFVYTVEAIEQFQEFNDEILKLDDNDLDDEDDEVFVQALVKDVNQKREKNLKYRNKQVEKILQLKAFLSQKPPKIGVHFQQKIKQPSHQSQEKQAIQDKKKAQVEYYQERQQEAQMIFYDLKEKLEQIIYLPDILIKESEQFPKENEDIEIERPYKVNGDESIDPLAHNSNPKQYVEDQLNIQIPQSNSLKNHSIKQETQNSKIDLYKLLEDIRQDPEKFAAIFNDKMAADAILQIDMKELNENTVRQEEILDQLNEELEQQKNNLEINQQNSIDHKTYDEKQRIEEQDLRNFENIQDQHRKKEVEEKNLIQSILCKYKNTEAVKKQEKKQSFNQFQLEWEQYWGSLNKEQIRQVKSKNEILGSLITNQYDAEQMFTDHIHFKKLTKETRQIVDKIRLQCQECTNAFAYRIYAVLDAADIDYPDVEIEKILKHYQRFWPYEPLDLDTQKDYGYNVPAVVSSASILKKLNQDEEDKKNAEEKKKQARKNKRMKVDKGLTDFQKKMMDSALWIAFQHKMEIKLLFLHQKKFIIFVTQQISMYRQPHAIQKVVMLQALNNLNSMTNKAKLINPIRKTLSIDEFSDEYKHFMKANPWNLHELQEIDNKDTQTAQEAVLSQQMKIMDEKHFYDTYMKIHIVKSQIEKNKAKAAQKAYMKKHQKYYSSQVKESLVQNNSGAQRIQKLVNEDKCNYSKLSQYNIQDTEFNQEFIEKANEVYKSQLFQIPEEGFGGNSKSQRAQSHNELKSTKQNYMKHTQSQNQKFKDQSKIPSILPNKPLGTKPPLQLQKINRLNKSLSSSNIKQSRGQSISLKTKNQYSSSVKDESLSERKKFSVSKKGRIAYLSSSPYKKMNEIFVKKLNSTIKCSNSSDFKVNEQIKSDLKKEKQFTKSDDFQNNQNWYFAASELDPQQQLAEIQNQDQFYNTIFEPKRASLGTNNANFLMTDSQLSAKMSKNHNIYSLPSTLSINPGEDCSASLTQDTNKKIKIKKIKLPSIKDNNNLKQILKKL